MTSASYTSPANRVLDSEANLRPAVAIISPQQTPYRLHFLRRVAQELRDVRLFSVFTHEMGDSTWTLPSPPEIRPVQFGAGEAMLNQARLSHAHHEWRRGGRIIRWMKQNDVKAVMLFGYNDLGRLRIIRWCRAHHIPCFLFGDSNIRGDLATGIKSLLKKVLVTRVVKSCTGVMPCGTLGTEYFKKYGADSDRIFPSPYEPDYALLRALPQSEIDTARGKYGLVEGRRRIVFCARMVPVKRPDLLIDAFIAVANLRPDWDLVMIGDGPLRASLTARVPLGLTSRIIWTGFIDSQTTVGALYRACDVLALPSDYEPWALVVNEAIAAGLAVISSDVVGAAADLVHEGMNGTIFPAGDCRALQGALLDVTASERIEALKAGSARALSEWRDRADPVDGLRRALEFSGVLASRT
jgi:glycosyltransferase involved in cell wall biosynthesis